MGGKKKADKEKPLEKMTAKELREAAGKEESIVGAHGMNKEELLAAIRDARGIEAPAGKKKDSGVRELKKQIKALKEKRAKAIESDDQKMAGIYRKRIIRLKKKSRRAA
jgi:protein-arginine kinase activator protein McsA